MRKILTLLAGAIVIASCSSPKYSYHFDHYDYNSGKKKNLAQAEVMPDGEQSPLLLEKESLTADAATPTPATAEQLAANPEVKKAADKIAAMSKSEKKELKTVIKKYAKSLKKSDDNGNGVKATKAWDHDLKMATIFGIVGVVLTALYGISPVFYVLGIVALVVAIVFLIKWISRQ